MSNIFISDWFRRSADYTRANKDMKLGWDSNLASKFSSYLYSSTKANALICNKSVLADELMQVITGVGVKNVSLGIDSNSENSMTDGKRIIISNKFETAVGDDYDVLDLIIGLVCHEASHCLYTDFKLMEKESKANNVNQIIHWLHNIIEDELIETKLGTAYPGYINFISKVKYYYFDKCFNGIINEDCKNELDIIMNLFLYTIRYPKYLSNVPKVILDKYDDLFCKIKNILGETGCLDTRFTNQITHLSLLAARKIYELLREYIDEKNDGDGDSSDKKNNSGNSTSNSSGSSSDTSSNNSGGSKSGDNNEETSDNNDTQNSTQKSFIEQAKEVLDDENSVMQKTAKVFSKCSSSSESNKPYTFSKILSEKMTEFMKETEENITKHIGDPLERIGVEFAASPDVIKYNAAVRLMQPFINTCKKMFVKNSTMPILVSNRYCKNGAFDTSRSAELLSGFNTVFSRRSYIEGKKSAKFALVLTLDESGSMLWGGCHTKTSNVAIMITEALKEYPEIELYIYGHGDNVVTYKNKKINKIHSLANRKIQCEQCEEESYKIIINEVKHQTNLPIVVINITDSAYLSDAEAVKNVIHNYVKQNCSFNCICIGSETVQDSLAELNDTIYGKGNWVVLQKCDNQIINMINKLSKIIEKNYMKSRR